MDFENVTVVALAHNGERCIRRTVDSLVAQTRPPERIVVADMGSSDNTYPVLCDMLGLEPIEHEGKRALPPKGEGAYQGLPVTTLRMPPQATPGQCLRAAMEVAWAETTIFGFVSAGAVYHPNKIEKSIAVLQANPIVVAVVSDFTIEREGGREHREYGRPFDWFQLLGGPMHDSNCLVRKAAMEQSRATFNPQLHHAVFYELFLRLARVGIIYHLPESLHVRPEKKVEDTEAVRREVIRVRDAVVKGMA